MKSKIKKIKWISSCVLIWLSLVSVSFSYAESVQLWITRNFHEEVLLQAEVNFENQSVVEILREHADVKTSFAGGFVESINGIGAGGQDSRGKNWFYYINGRLAHVGARQYFPKDGDVIWWDFHRWDNAVYISSLIGAFPQTFIHGYGGVVPKTEILCSTNLCPSAQELAESLKGQGVRDVVVREYSSGAVSRRVNTVILAAEWEAIQEDPQIVSLTEHFRKTGFFVKFEKDGLSALNMSGEAVRHFEKGAVILATGAGFAVQPPLWLVIGTDDEQVKKAVDLLIHEPERIQLYSGVILADGEIFNVPVFE